MALLNILAEFLGWIFFLCWAFCNLPQFVLIHRTKSVAGFSITFQILNMLGFLAYEVYIVYGFIYQHRHDVTKSIVWQDIAWCSITLFVVYGIAIQCWVYRKTITESVHWFYQCVVFSIIIIVVYNIPLVSFGYLPLYSTDRYSALKFLGYTKTFISFIKYTPVCRLNFVNKSTKGFSIYQIILDITGALTSFLQSMLNAYIYAKPDGNPDWETVFGNLPKLFLSIESLFFCSILLIQHYVLYGAEVPYDSINSKYHTFNSENDENDENDDQQLIHPEKQRSKHPNNPKMYPSSSAEFNLPHSKSPTSFSNGNSLKYVSDNVEYKPMSQTSSGLDHAQHGLLSKKPSGTNSPDEYNHERYGRSSDEDVGSEQEGSEVESNDRTSGIDMRLDISREIGDG
jgi:cystinosin